jgi:hypothetical protein
MKLLFVICALSGGAVMFGQFLLSVLGMVDHGGDLDHELDADHDFGDSADDAGHDGAAHDGGDQSGEHHGDHTHHSTSFFRVITFRTLVAALTFFGLVGAAAESGGLHDPWPLVLALASGAGAMWGVHSMMRLLNKLRADGTERIDRAVGCEGTVYLSIPGNNEGAGKIHVTMQNRLVELTAMTSGERLPASTQVVVVEVLGPSTVKVEPATAVARNEHV